MTEPHVHDGANGAGQTDNDDFNVQWEDEVAADGALPFTIHDAADIGDLSRLPPTKFILGDQFAKGYVSSVIAPGSTGKTAIRVAQGLSVATGRALTDEPVHLRCKVLFVCFEDSKLELEKRVGAAMRHYGVTADDVRGGWLRLATPGREAGKLLEIDPESGKMVEGEFVGYLERMIEETGAGLVILDPLKKLHGVNENDNTGIDEVVGILTELAIRLDVAIDVPQHARKGAPGAAQEAGSQDMARGASAGVDAMRVVTTATRMAVKEAESFHVLVEDRRSYVRIDPAKVNLTRPARTATWFRLIGVDLENATANYPRSDNIVVATRWHPPDVSVGMDEEMNERVLAEILAGPGDGEFYSDAASAKERNVGHAFRKHIDKSDEEARRLVDDWVRQGLLRREKYKGKNRKDVSGLFAGVLMTLRRANRKAEKS